MNTVSNRPELDEELAAITDRLLAGENPKGQSISPENEALADVVQRLYSTIGPTSKGISATSRNRLTQALNEEWAVSSRKNSQSRSNIVQMVSSRNVRILSAAAVVGLVLVFVFIILGGQGPANQVVGSAVGSGQIGVPVVIVGVLVLAGAGFWWFRRR